MSSSSSSSTPLLKPKPEESASEHFVKTIQWEGVNIEATVGSHVACSWKAFANDCQEPFEIVEKADIVTTDDVTKMDWRLPLGMHYGILTTRHGEISTFEIPQTSGFLSGCGPASLTDEAYPLIYEFKNFNISNVEDISPEKDGSVLFRKTIEGVGYQPAPDESEVSVHFRLLLQDDGTIIHDTYEAKQPLTFVTGRNEVMPCLDLAVSLMYVQDVVVLSSSALFAYGPKGCEDKNYDKRTPRKGVWDDTVVEDRQKWPFYDSKYVGRDVEYIDLRLLKFTPKPSIWELAEEEKRIAATIAAQRAFRYSTNGKWFLAYKYFDKAKDYLELNGGDASDDDLDKAQEILMRVYNSMSIAAMSIGRFTEGLQLIEKMEKQSKTSEVLNIELQTRKLECLRAIERLDCEGHLIAITPTSTEEVISTEHSPIISPDVGTLDEATNTDSKNAENVTSDENEEEVLACVSSL